MKRLSLLNGLPSLFGLAAVLAYPIYSLGLLSSAHGLMLEYGAELVTLIAGMVAISKHKRLHPSRALYLLNVCWTAQSIAFFVLIAMLSLGPVLHG